MVRVGFVGLGVMGTSMARNIRKAGIEVAVYNRSPDKSAALAAEGFATASSPRALAEQIDQLCVCVTDGAAVRDLLFGESGVVAAGARLRAIVDFSTISPSESEQIALNLKPFGIKYLDAPVSGGDVGARDGTLTVMVGGDTDAVESVMPVLSAIGRKIVHMGPVGAGQRTKCVNQIAVAIGVAAMTEAMVMARSSGLDVAQVLDVIGSGAAGSWAIQNYAPRVLKGELGPGFYAKHMLKDLRIAGREAETSNTSLPVTGLVRELYTALCAGEGAELGNHALITLYDRLLEETTKGERRL